MHRPGSEPLSASAPSGRPVSDHLAHSTLSAVDFLMSSGALSGGVSETPGPLKSLPRVSVIAGTPWELVTLSPGFIADPDRPMTAASRRAWSAWSGAYSSVVRLSSFGALPPFSDLVTPSCTWSQLRVFWALPWAAPPRSEERRVG